MIKRIALYICWFTLISHFVVFSQNVIIVVIDGARYTETFGAESLNIPKIWNLMRPKGTIWTHFRNEGITLTNPGHASIETGTWQILDNNGTQRPTQPTVFEYFRKAKGVSEHTTAVVVGKNKLDILAYSKNTEYGEKYKALLSIGKDDISVVNNLKNILISNHPKLMLVNLPSTDVAGHSGNWIKYLAAIHTADSLVFEIWQTLQSDSIYCNNTTLFITNDHGRHDNMHGGFENHGDDCEGCRHIICLAIGRGFPANNIVTTTRTQCDIAPTVGELLSFRTVFSIGTSLLRDTSLSVK